MDYKFTIGVGHTLSRESISISILPAFNLLNDSFHCGLDVTWLGLHLFIGFRSMKAYMEDMKERGEAVEDEEG